VAAVLLAGAVLLAVMLAGESSRAMLASARLSCLCNLSQLLAQLPLLLYLVSTRQEPDVGLDSLRWLLVKCGLVACIMRTVKCVQYAENQLVPIRSCSSVRFGRESLCVICYRVLWAVIGQIWQMQDQNQRSSLQD